MSTRNLPVDTWMVVEQHSAWKRLAQRSVLWAVGVRCATDSTTRQARYGRSIEPLFLLSRSASAAP
jgi:hypothetical protein